MPDSALQVSPNALRRLAQRVIAAGVEAAQKIGLRSFTLIIRCDGHKVTLGLGAEKMAWEQYNILGVYDITAEESSTI